MVEEPGVAKQKHGSYVSHWHTFSHESVSWVGIKRQTLVVIDTDCIGRC